MITVEEMDGNWRIYRWTDEGFLCYSRRKGDEHKYHLCCEVPGEFSLNQVYNACYKASEGKKYNQSRYNCNSWTEQVMKNLTDQDCFQAKAWSHCRAQGSSFKSCSDMDKFNMIEPQDQIDQSIHSADQSFSIDQNCNHSLNLKF